MDQKQVTLALSESLESSKLVVNDLLVQRPRVEVGGLTDALGEYLYETFLATSLAAEKAAERAGIVLHDVQECVRWLLVKRIEQVACERPGSEYKHIEFPLCLYPLVETFGRIENFEAGLDIRPEHPDPKSKKPLERPSKYDACIRLLRTYGIPMAKGLPIVLKMTSDVFYRLTIQDGLILAACDGQNVDPATVLTRCFFDMPILSIFGTPRYNVGYVAIQGSALSLLVRLGLAE